MKTALRNLAVDNDLTPFDKSVMDDILELLPDIVALRRRGYGVLMVKYHSWTIAEQDCTLRKRKDKRANEQIALTKVRAENIDTSGPD